MEKLKRLQSGIEGLDALLQGGLVAGASYIVQGRPGSGKTILANQLGFNHARNGGRVLVATLLAESHDRLFQFLSTMSFSTPREWALKYSLSALSIRWKTKASMKW